MRATVIAVSLLLAVGLASLGCRPLATADQLEWCAENQNDVARAALALGLMDRGTSFTDWKLSSNEGYNRACIRAFYQVNVRQR